MVCHDRASGDDFETASSSGPPRFSLQASHPIRIQVRPGDGKDNQRIRTTIDGRIRLFEGFIECQTCHALLSPMEDFLVAFETKYELCRGCHQLEARSADLLLAGSP
jgi:predicted CXXCH cytochrome family protein